MDGAYSQEHNLGWVETTLGKDHLLLRKFTGTDRLDDLFDYTLRALAPEGLDTDALLGTHCTVFIHSVHHGAIPFDGIVTEIEWKQHSAEGDEYAVRLRPWFWLAGLRRQQRIFHEKPVDEILEEVLSAWSGTGEQTLRIELTQAYPKLEYTVQYGESDLAFARRMMERFGISFHFEHGPGNHCLVLTDAAESLGELPGLSREYRPVGEFFHKGEEHFWEWREGRGITTGKVRLTDYNFKTPGANMLTEQLGEAVHAQGEIESYDYPGVYPDAGEGRDVVALRSLQERAGDYRTHVQGDVLSLKSGMRCAAHGPYAAFTRGEEHICLEARHSFTAEAYRSGSDTGDMDRAYEGGYTLIPISRPYAPKRTTPAPIIHGPQTARVVGEGEIDCDEYGRILVRFHWDLDDAFSMRCRVSQNWASKGWGGMVIPRIGMEVVVEFLEGDPDKPLVTGCVYNGKNEVPYELPRHKTKSVFRSDTHQGGGFNELTFEDERGEENISLHAQKDQTLKVLNNRMKRVDNDQVESVGRNKAIDVRRNHQENIGGSMNLSVGGGGFGQFLALGGVAAAGGMDALAGSEAVGDKAVSGFVGGLAQVGAAVEAMTGSAAGGFRVAGGHLQIAGAEQVSAGTSFGALLSSTMPMSGVLNTVVEKFVSDTIGLARTEQIGAYKNTSVGHTMTVHVGREFIINVGKSKFVMDSDGNVTIIGTKFNFSASGHVQINGKIVDIN